MAAYQPLEAQILEELLFESFELLIGHFFHDSNVIRNRRIAKHDLLEMGVRPLIWLRFQTVFKGADLALQNVLEELLLCMDVYVLDLRKDFGQILLHFVIVGNVAEIQMVTLDTKVRRDSSLVGNVVQLSHMFA